MSDSCAILRVLPPEDFPLPWLDELERPGVSMGLVLDDLQQPTFKLDHKYGAYLKQKHGLLSKQQTRSEVFRSPDATDLTEVAKREVLSLVIDDLAKHYPKVVTVERDQRGSGGQVKTVTNAVTGDVWHIADLANDPESDPLIVASLLVPDDLVLMKPPVPYQPPDDNEDDDDDEEEEEEEEDLDLEKYGAYLLAAGAVYFPAHWRLAEKAGRPLRSIHAQVLLRHPFTHLDAKQIMIGWLLDNCLSVC